MCPAANHCWQRRKHEHIHNRRPKQHFGLHGRHGVQSEHLQFDSQAALAKLSADWPMSRFVEIWNSIPGNTEVSKLGDRKKAVARIWKAIQPLAGGKPEARPKKEAKGAKPAKKAKTAKKARPATH